MSFRVEEVKKCIIIFGENGEGARNDFKLK
jgi:hypothetical protein